MNITNLKKLAKDLGVVGYAKYKAGDKETLVRLVLEKRKPTVGGVKETKESEVVLAVQRPMPPAPLPPVQKGQEDIRKMNITNLKKLAKDLGVVGYAKYKAGDKETLVRLVLEKRKPATGEVVREQVVIVPPAPVKGKETEDVHGMNITNLKKLAKELGVVGYAKYKAGDKETLVRLILEKRKPTGQQVVPVKAAELVLPVPSPPRQKTPTPSPVASPVRPQRTPTPVASPARPQRTPTPSPVASPARPQKTPTPSPVASPVRPQKEISPIVTAVSEPKGKQAEISPININSLLEKASTEEEIRKAILNCLGLYDDISSNDELLN